MCMETTVCHWDKFTGKSANSKKAKQILRLAASEYAIIAKITYIITNIVDYH